MNIEKEFQQETLLVKECLLLAKKECDNNETLLHGQTRVEFIKKLADQYYSSITQSFTRLTHIILEANSEVYGKCKAFIRQHLYLLMADAATEVNKQIGEKPLGYAGDYVVADFFYKDGYSGKTLFAMFMDRYTLESPLARAHINRRYYLRKYIEKLSRRSKGGVHITSFACGPAPEVFDLIDQGVENIKFTLIDGEAGAINLLKKELEQRVDSKVQVAIHHANIINLIRKEDRFDLPPQDFVYCAGFFDYIRAATASKCIKYMMSYLKSGGVLIVVNVSMHDEKNVYLKMLGEWELYHRSKQDLLLLVNNIRDVRYKKVVFDYPTKRNLYLIIKKA